jgi:large subunit ribosomal protein L24
MRGARTGKKRHTLKIRSGDHVKVMAGKDRGKSGRVLRVEPAKERLYVEGLNMVKRHMKPTVVQDTTKGQSIGGVIDREGPIHISNVMLLDGKGRPTRVRVERENGARFRVAKTSGARLE